MDIMRQAGIQVLLDEVVTIDETLILVGIEDRATASRFGISLTPFSQLAAEVGDSLPKILLHHTPVMLKEADAAGFDLQISGHTHKGQLFPSNLFAHLSYRAVSGMKKIGKNLKVFVSNGYGTWGPPMRIGATPQIVRIRLSARLIKSTHKSP